MKKVFDVTNSACCFDGRGAFEMTNRGDDGMTGGRAQDASPTARAAVQGGHSPPFFLVFCQVNCLPVALE